MRASEAKWWPWCFRPVMYTQTLEEMNRAKGGVLKYIDGILANLPENSEGFSIKLSKDAFNELVGIYGKPVDEYRGFKVERM